VLFVAASCNSGSGSGSTSKGALFEISSISVGQGSIWKLNRPIDISFTRDVDIDSVSLNTINLADVQGQPATGTFTLLPNKRTIRFQPSCPTLPDASDAGLRPGGVSYLLHVLGSTTGGLTVMSTAGDGIRQSQSVSFTTPNSTDPLALFLDTVPGPPEVRVRGRGSVANDPSETSATYVEVGGDDSQRAYFVWDPATQTATLDPEEFLDGAHVPLNLYSRQSSQVSIVVHIDQPVGTSADNISDEKLGIEYEAAGGNWLKVGTDVELEANCTETGAVLRLTPQGILPQDAPLRVNMRQGFADLTEDSTILDSSNFAVMETTIAANPVPQDPPAGGGIDPAASLGDEFLEGFTLSGDADGSFEDTDAAFGTPYAVWGSGELRASFEFGGTGGPGGDFDWHLDPGVTVILDSTADTIVGGEGGLPETSQSVINGVIDVRNLVIPDGAELIVQGPNPCTILASGTVTIAGTLSVSGSKNEGVGTLNTTNQPESGASGQAGGGAGGTGSFLTNQSTPRGGRGRGAFDTPGGGGEGGESSYHPSSKNARRGAGGGGGSFGKDVMYPWMDGNNISNFVIDLVTPTNSSPMIRCQEMVGLDGEDGRPGGPNGTGAESQSARAEGGSRGPTPFFDELEENDFLGNMLVGEPGEEVLVTGELTKMWAGAGGGGGGDAIKSSSFPLTPFIITGDEKGCGGGGGAGGLRILSIGDVTIESTASITANGGAGGGGENTNYFDRVAGGSGGGSGGHIVISTAGNIIVEGEGGQTAPSELNYWYNDDDAGHKARSISALGGQGGAGANNKGGAKETGVTNWRCDCVPIEVFVEGLESPPMWSDAGSIDTCFRAMDGVGTGVSNLENWIDPEACSPGAGGDGTPGIIQFHVDDPALNLQFPDILGITAGDAYGAGLDVTRCVAPPPYGWNGIDDTDGLDELSPVGHLIPFFGRRSTAQSDWIALGLARANVNDEPVRFLFGGTDDTTGEVSQAGNSVVLDSAIVAGAPIGTAPTTPYLAGGDKLSVVFDASGLTGSDTELYRRNPELLRLFSVKVYETANEAGNFHYRSIAVVGSAEEGLEAWESGYDFDTDTLLVTVSGTDSIEIAGLAAGETSLSLVPHRFRVVTSELQGSLPDDTSITIQFDATKLTQDGSGEPDEAQAIGFTADIDDLNGDDWDFFRFQVLFDLDANATGSINLSTPRPALEFLRIPFAFGEAP